MMYCKQVYLEMKYVQCQTTFTLSNVKQDDKKIYYLIPIAQGKLTFDIYNFVMLWLENRLRKYKCVKETYRNEAISWESRKRLTQVLFMKKWRIIVNNTATKISLAKKDISSFITSCKYYIRIKSLSAICVDERQQVSFFLQLNIIIFHVNYMSRKR